MPAMSSPFRRATSTLLATTAGILALGAGTAGAATPKLSLKVSGPTIEGVPFKEVAGTETTLLLAGTVKGKVPAGAKVRLAVKAQPSAPFKFAKGTLKVTGGRVKTALNATASNTMAYQLVVVSKQGRSLARSKAATVVWIAPPTSLGVSFYGEGAEIQLPSGKVSCGSGVETAAATCFNAKGGHSANVELPLSAITTTIGTPPGSTIVTYLNGAVVCTAHGPNGSCINTEVRTPAETSPTQVPASAEYRSPAGAVYKVTVMVTIFP